MTPTAPVILTLLCLAALGAACDQDPAPDEALYRRARDAGARRGPEAETAHRQLLQQLLTQHPGSKFTADARLALAELAFNDGDFATALGHYEAVHAYPADKRWAYALFKQGWCHLNRNDAARARVTFEKVIALENDPRVATERRAELVAEARRALVKAYGASAGADGAAAYFQRWGGDEVPALLEALGEHYFEAGRVGEAASVFRELVATNAAAAPPRLCAWQNMIVRTSFVLGTDKDQVEEVQRLGAVLARLEQTSPGPATETCRLTLRDTLKELALLTHRKAQNGKTAGLLELADPLYRQYLTRFRQEKDGYMMTFHHAEVLWSLGRWKESAAEYRRVLEMDPQGKLTEEAAYGHVLATRNALGLDEAGAGKDAPPAGPLPAPVPLPPAQATLMAAFDTFLAHVRAGDERPRIQYRQARTYHEYGHYETAARLLAAFVAEHPDDELAAFAVNLELDALATAGKTAALCARVSEYREGRVAARDRALSRTLQALGRGCPASIRSPSTAP